MNVTNPITLNEFLVFSMKEKFPRILLAGFQEVINAMKYELPPQLKAGIWFNMFAVYIRTKKIEHDAVKRSQQRILFNKVFNIRRNK